MHAPHAHELSFVYESLTLKAHTTRKTIYSEKT